MFAARLAQAPSPTDKVRLAALPTAILRRAWVHLWWSVRTHMADLHGWPRPPEPRWPRLML
jgi:hypothetical protein